MTRTGETDGLGAATSLEGVTVRGDRNLLADTAVPGMKGARAALETFYYAFNTRSLNLMQEIWADDPLAQLDTPLVGLVRGSARIAAAYARGLSGPARVETVVEDIVAYLAPEMVVFTERERGISTTNGEHAAPTELSGRTVCVFRFITSQGGWRLIYHRVSLDDRSDIAKAQSGMRERQEKSSGGQRPSVRPTRLDEAGENTSLHPSGMPH